MDVNLNNRKKPDYRSLLCSAVLTLFSFLMILGVALGTFGNFRHRSYTLALMISAALTGCLFLCRRGLEKACRRLEEIPAWKTALVLAGLCLLLNGAWVLLFRPEQAPDYQTFYQAAVDLSEGQHPQNRAYIAMFPHILGYASFLSVFLRLFGRSLMTAAAVNVALTTLSGLILFTLCLKWRGRAAACFGFAFWILCPSKTLYNTMTLSEPYYTFLILLWFLCVVSEQRTLVSRAFLGMMSGVLLRLVNTARPIGVIPIIALAVWLLFLSAPAERKENGFKWFVFLSGLLCVYLITGPIWEKYMTEQLEQRPASVPGYSVYVGFNPDTQGTYSDADMDLLQSRYFGEYDEDADSAQKSMLEAARLRIAENKNRIPGIILHKLGVLLGHDEGGAYYSKESLSPRCYSVLCVLSNIWYYFISLLAVCGSLDFMRRRENSIWIVLPLFGVGLILAQLLVEVAARYHYALIPVLAVLAASGTDRLWKRGETE
ncbi:MAG: hypothetical protein K6C12_12300 [Oscillospiraceae bacterium]|nr:hypothetical protein [Oscillospiraceae bacterium]